MGILRWGLKNEMDAGWGVDTQHRYRLSFWIEMASIHETAFDLLSSSQCPVRLGVPFYRFLRNAAGVWYLGDLIDASARCVFVNPRKDPSHPRIWHLEADWEGMAEPTAIPPEVEFTDVPFQEHQVQDINGLVATNSALDPYEDGLPADRMRTVLLIERNIPYQSWNPDLVEKYKGSKNKFPYVYGTLGYFQGTEFVSRTAAPGKARLSSLTARRMIRSPSPRAIDSAPVEWRPDFYWRIKAVIEIDDRKFIDNNGQEDTTRWRRVLVDAGTRELQQGKPTENVGRFGFGTNVELLDGAGKRLMRIPDLRATFPNQLFDPPALGIVHDQGGAITGAPVPNHDWYVTRENTGAGQKLTVPAPGVLANDVRVRDADGVWGVTAPATNPLFGTLNMNIDGSFTYTPVTGYVGWDYFTYTVETLLGGLSYPATVVILVGRTPRVRVFEQHPEKDWYEIAQYIGGW